MTRSAILTAILLLSAPGAFAEGNISSPSPTVIISESGGADGGNAAALAHLILSQGQEGEGSRRFAAN